MELYRRDFEFLQPDFIDSAADGSSDELDEALED